VSKKRTKKKKGPTETKQRLKKKTPRPNFEIRITDTIARPTFSFFLVRILVTIIGMSKDN